MTFGGLASPDQISHQRVSSGGGYAMTRNGDHIEAPPTAARSATKEGVGRYVLAISLFLVIVAFIIAYFAIR
jgi:hypothetical protein